MERTTQCLFTLLAGLSAIGPAAAQDRIEKPFAGYADPADYVFVSREEGVTRVKSGMTEATLYQDPCSNDAIHWAMNHRPITIVAEGTYALSGTIEVPRANVSLVITEKAILTVAPDAALTVVSEGHGDYRSLIHNAGHDNVSIVNLGTLDAAGHVAILVEGRSGGKCGINRGLIFSCGTLCSGGDAVWIVDARNLRVPLIWCDRPANTLAIEGCEDLTIGTVAELATAGRNSGRHGNEAVDLNSYSRRVHVELAIGKPPCEEVIDINNSPDCVFDEVRSYGKTRLVSRTVYPPTGRRLTQRPRISHSNGTVVKKETVVEKELQSWKTQVVADGLPDTLPRITVAVKLVAVFKDGSEEEVLDKIYHLDLNPPRMYYADDVSGRPFSKDPAVVKSKGKYWLYYSVPPYQGKPTTGWTIGVATSDNLVDWTKAGELRNTGQPEAKGFTAPGAIVLDGKVHLFYQTYGNGRRDAICHAWSEDGLNFTRNPTNPIFRPTGKWTVGRAIDADVITHGDRLLLYWATRDPTMKIQMQGVAAAPLNSKLARQDWTQLNPHGPILAPTVPTELDDPDLDLGWERRCIEGAAMARHDGRLYMFYAGGYNNDPQQIGVAVSDDGVKFKRLSDKPLLPNGPPGSWNSSESGHPYLFQDDDGQDYLFYQGNNTRGKSWYLSVVPIDWKDGRPLVAPEKLTNHRVSCGQWRHGLLAKYCQLLQRADSHSHKCPLYVGNADCGRVTDERW